MSSVGLSCRTTYCIFRNRHLTFTDCFIVCPQESVGGWEVAVGDLHDALDVII